ncbi:serine hydrolase [Flavobacteriaceae bacterium M23B6Z8]
MKNLLFLIYFTIFLCHLNALAQVETSSPTYIQIMQRDSLLFQQAFNKCNTKVLHEIIATDFEFYHDQSGTTYGKENFIKGIEKNICSLKYQPVRKLISNEIFLLKSNGIVYGVLQIGTHKFYAHEQNKEPYLTSSANFTHLWIQKTNKWVLKRVLSYNHQPTGIIQNQKSAMLPGDSFSVENWLLKHKVPALGIAVLKNRRVQQVSVYGELEKGVPAHYNTIFNVASLTKPIVSTMVLQLVENGNWDLDEPLYKYWTDPDVKDDPYSKKLTTRHILSHQSGFKNWRYQNESGRLDFDFEPGSAFQYSGEGFQYLKRAIESKFEKSLEKITDSLIFKPLKMTNTSFIWIETMEEKGFAKWHDEKGNASYPFHKNRQANAADDLLTTVEDYARFAAFILNGAALSEDLFEEMVRQQTNEKSSIKIGLGWEILPNLKGNEYALLHTGGDIGVNTLIILLPMTGEGLVIFTNGDNGKKLFFELIENHLSLGREITGKAN